MFFNFFKRKEESKSEYSESIDSLLSIDITKYSKVHSSEYSSRVITVPFPDIESFNIFLSRIVGKIKNQQTITSHDRQSIVFTDVYLSQFFINQKGYYIDYEKEINLFINNSIFLLEIFNNKDEDNDNNKRMLYDIVLNITTLSREMVI